MKDSAVSLQQLRQTIEEDTPARILRVSHVGWNVPYPLVRVHYVGVAFPDYLRDQGLQCFRAGLIFNEYLEVHGSPRIEIVAVPKPAQGKSLGDQGLDDRILACPSHLRKPVVPFFEHPDLLGFQRVHEVGLMRRDEHLRPALLGGMFPELPGKRLKQFVVKAVLRFLDAQEGRWRRVLKQQKVSEDLQGAIRYLLRIEGIAKAPVVEAQEEPAIPRPFGIDAVDAGDLPRDAVQDGLELLRCSRSMN